VPDEVLPLQKDYTIVGLEISRKSRPLLWAQKFSDPCSEIFDPGAVQEQQSQYQAGKEGEEIGEFTDGLLHAGRSFHHRPDHPGCTISGIGIYFPDPLTFYWR